MKNICSIKYERPFKSFSTSGSPSDNDTDLSKQLLLDKRNDRTHAAVFKGAFQKPRIRGKPD